MTDIVTKLNNWSKYATAGQRAVLQEAMREIIKTREAAEINRPALTQYERNIESGRLKRKIAKP